MVGSTSVAGEGAATGGGGGKADAVLPWLLLGIE